MTALPRAMTAGELAYIRSDQQGSSLYLCIHKPAQVYTALVNQTFSSLDEVTQVAYDTGSGTIGNVLPGMTLWVSAIGYGQCELGQCRIRTAPAGSIFYIGENSDIPWADDVYLTVMDEFGIWTRALAIDSSSNSYMDYNIAYSDQHVNCNPVPILGPRLVPAWLTGATVVIPFDASLSYVLGSSISGYSWSVTGPGSPSLSGAATATPSLTCSVVGLYRLACALTATNGKTTTGYVYVQVFDQNANLPINQFDLTNNITGRRTDGGWTFSVRMYSQADFSSVVDRAMVCLFARDFYGTTEVSIGPITGRENIIAIGWISGESINEDPDGSYIDFTVDGLGPWMKKLSAFPIGIQNVTTAPTVWTSWQGLTVDDSLWHLFYWQSTIIPATDVFLTGDSRVSAQQYAPGSTVIMDQITYLLKNTILGDACSDRYNRLFCEVDEQLTPPASRSTIPSVLTLQYNDWRDQLAITRIVQNVTSQVNLSGVAIQLPNTPLSYFSLAPGHDYLRWGVPKTLDKLLLTDQPTSNQLAAMQLAWDNHQLEFTADLGGNNRMVDITPHQFVSLAVVASDTPRGFTYSGHIIVRQVDISLDKSSKDDSAFLQISWQAESETFPGNSSNGDVPVSSTTTVPPVPKLPALPLLPLISTTPTGAPKFVVTVPFNGTTHLFGIFYTLNPSAVAPNIVNWLAMNDGIDTRDLALSYFHDFVCDPLTGEMFILADGFSSGSGNSVYYSPQPGAPWTCILTTAQATSLLGLVGGHTGAAKAIGINKGSYPAEVCVLMGQRDTGLSNTNYWCKGSSAGFPTKGVAASITFATGALIGNIIYGNNQWTHVYDSPGNVLQFHWCDRNAASAGWNHSVSYVGYIEPREIRGAKDGSVLYVIGASFGTDVNVIGTSPDNGATYTETSGGLHPITNTPEGDYVDSAPDGLTLMAGDLSHVNAKRSTDGATTWGNIGIAGDYEVFACYGTPSLWVTSGVQAVKYSMDGGTTWTDITGDLLTWIPISTNWYAKWIKAW